MLNVRKWIERFQALSDSSQIKVVEGIIEELEFNEEVFDDDEYNKQKSSHMREILNKYIQDINNKNRLTQVSEIMIRFEKLPEADKTRIISHIFDDMVIDCEQVEARLESEQKKTEHQQLKNICAAEGHNYGKWKIRKWTTTATYGPSGIETAMMGNPYNTYEVKHSEWIRTCARCGYVEHSQTKPDEVKAIEAKRRIKSLQRQLDKLNNDKE